MKFFELFPTPRYLTIAEAGVSISESALYFVSLEHEKPGALRVRKHGSISLPDGAVVAGKVADGQALAAALGRLKSEHGFKYVSVSLPEEKAYLFATAVDKVPYKDLYDAVAFTVEANVPVTLSESVLSFETLVRPDKVKAAVSVLPLEVVGGFVDALSAAGLVTASIDIEPQAIARAMVAKGDSRSHLIVNLGRKKTGFYLVDDEVVQFSSTVAADLGSPDAVENLKAEIRKFFVFWNTRLDPDGASQRKIEHVILCGEGSRDDAFAANVMSEVETPYSLGNVWVNVCPVEKRLPDISFEESLSYAAAVGTALPSSNHTYV
jgi:hypothetical protein